MYGIVLLIALVILVGLALRYGNSSIGLFKTAGSAVYGETQLLTLANTGASNYPYYGP